MLSHVVTDKLRAQPLLLLTCRHTAARSSYFRSSLRRDGAHTQPGTPGRVPWWLLSQAQRELEQRHCVRVASWAGAESSPDSVRAGWSTIKYNSHKHQVSCEFALQAQRELEQRHGVRVASWAGELARPETLEAAFEVVRRDFGGRLSAFVHNAGALQACSGAGVFGHGICLLPGQATVHGASAASMRWWAYGHASWN